MRRFRLAAFPLLLALPASAGATLPDPVRAMLNAAVATRDDAKVAAVVEIAKQTNPDDVDEIDAIHGNFREAQAKRSEAAELVTAERIRNAGLFDRWSGQIEAGASRSTGNSDVVGFNGGFNLNREGIDWTHRLRGTIDYQRSNDNLTREQFFAAYEPRYQIDPRLFTYGLAQFERDRLQGYAGRYAVSGGLGYNLFQGPELSLSVKAGPALRYTDFLAQESDIRIAGLLGLDFDWQITDRLKLTQDTNAVAETGGAAVIIADSRNTSINVATGLNVQISDRLTTRLSYTVDYDSNPPVGAVQTDTFSRFTLIYGF